MASVGFSSGGERSHREPTRLRRTVYLSVMMITLTSALYSLRGNDVRQPEVELDVHPKIARTASKEASLRSANLLVRNSRQATAADEGLDDQGPKPKHKNGRTTTNAASVPSSATPSAVTHSKKPKLLSTTTASPTASTASTPKSSMQWKTTADSTIATTISTSSSSESTESSSTAVASSTTSTPAKVTHAPTTEKILPTEEFCEEPAYHEFPADIFTNKQRADGAVVIHIFIGIYMFYALAVVCDEYFVAAMEKICESMGLSEDIAGATFMAAGSSAPELFASLLGVFVAKGDVGTGTIVGSAVFNVLFVIGFCAFFCGQTLSLNWWPLFRDSAYYALTVVVLVIVLADGFVTWKESVFMLILYVVYIVLMKYNMKLRFWLVENTRLRMMDELTECTQGILKYDDKQIRSSYVQFTNDGMVTDVDDVYAVSSWKNEDPSQLDVDEVIRDFPRKKVTLYEAALMIMMSRYFRSITRFRCAGKRIIVERRRIQTEGYAQKSINESHYPNPILISREMTKDSREAWKKAPTVEVEGLLAVVTWFVTIPVLATLYYTIPDCRNARWERYFVLTFLTAIVWIAFFSYILVWMVTLVGYTLGIPDTIMGITFLAAGTSVPDAYASLIVAKQGLADMAVANSLGSNVFDILIGLALPWFLKTAVTDPNSMVRIRSSGMVYNVILLFLSIFATGVAVHHCGWKLDKRLGVILLVCYAVFLFFAILIECNVFGFVNYPECEE